MMMGKFKRLFAGVWCAVYLTTTTVCASNAVTISDENLIIDTTGTEEKTTILSGTTIEQVEEGRFGSIQVTLTEGKTGTKNSGIKVICQKIAAIENGEYILLEDYKESGIDFSSVGTAEDLKNVAETIKKAEKNPEPKTKMEKTTDQNGTALFTELEVGVYLISTEDTATYDMVTPTLIAVPTWNESSGEMDYDVVVYPKHSEKPELEKTTAPQTGLQENTLLYLILAAICLSAACGLVVVKKRKR